MDSSGNASEKYHNGIEDEYLYDSELLKNLDWDDSRHLFTPEISPTNPGENLVVRPLATSDYDKGYPMVLSQLTELGEVSRERFLDAFHAMKACKNTYYVTVIEDTKTNEVVGVATLLVEQKIIHSCALRGRIEDVVINDSHRGKQLGKLIVIVLKQLAKHIGCYKLSLDCRDQMLKFYNQLGFNREEGNSNFMTIRFRS